MSSRDTDDSAALSCPKTDVCGQINRSVAYSAQSGTYRQRSLRVIGQTLERPLSSSLPTVSPLRVRRATALYLLPMVSAQFQSTPARGGRPWCVMNSFGPICCFNPRPRAAGDRRGDPGPYLCVSIHARARRATQWVAIDGTSRGFQSTPARGGRLGWIARRITASQI